MVLVFMILFASAACFTPGLAQSSGYASAVANANAASTGSIAIANAFGYVFFYPSNGGCRDCTYNRCTPTCSVPVPQNCPENSNPCNCPSGRIISEQGGQCVEVQECQKYQKCNGDPNASYSDCPVKCPSTCARPNADYCDTQCAAPGCECNPGYLLSSINGKCIKPEQCPGGKVCNKNEVFLSCVVECPDLYCPVDTNRVACGLARPCPSRCACAHNYLRKSVNNHTCILSTECPPGKCYGVNEEWNRCISPCVSDKCKDRNKVPVPDDCPFPPNECHPQCLCKRGFYRNERNVCVPVQQCPADN